MIAMTLQLLRPTIKMEKEYYDFIEEWEKNNEEIIPYSARLLDVDYKTW